MIFLNCSLAAPRLTFSHFPGGTLTHPMLITAFLHDRPKGQREPRSEVGSLSLAKRYCISADIVKKSVRLNFLILKHIFNISLTKGVFPDELKKVRATTIFKRESNSLVTNYRLILTLFLKIT